MAEYIKYNPDNFDPDNFMNPKSSVVWGELKYLNKKLGGAIEGNMRVNSKSMLVGSEFEIFFFDKDCDPCRMYKRYEDSERNPNYTEKHRQKVRDIARNAGRFGVNGNRFENCSRESTLLLEFRTAPLTIDKYLPTVMYLGDWIRKKSKEYGVMPVIHSQHTHISSNRHGFNLNGREETLSKDADESVIEAAFSRVLPLMLLPEEYDEETIPDAVAMNRNGHSHPEFRMLSSEYMNDPVLNLTVILRAMYASLYNPDFVTDKPSIPNKYKDAVRDFAQDEEMRGFFGGSTVDTLSQIASQYPAVSKRQISINEVLT